MIYFDNAAMARPDPEVIEKALPYLTENWGNPGSAYLFAEKSRRAVEEARENVAKYVGASPSEIYFTSGASESSNTIINSYRGIITTKIEHPSVLNVKSNNAYVELYRSGVVNLGSLRGLVHKYPQKLVSIGAANSEIGTIQPIEEIANLCRIFNVDYHCDITQLIAHSQMNLSNIEIDYASASGQKLGGVPGTGFMYIKSNKKKRIFPLIKGGGQENGMRSGTLNVFGIVALGEACKKKAANMLKSYTTETKLRDYMIKRISNEIPDCILNGPDYNRLPGNVNFSFKGVLSENLIIALDLEDICCSAGSACHANSKEASGVLRAIDVPEEYIHGTLRFSLCADNTTEEIDYVVEKLKNIVERQRKK